MEASEGGTDLERDGPAQGSHGEDEHCGEHQVEEEAAQEAVGRRAPCSHESAQPVAAATTITRRHDTPHQKQWRPRQPPAHQQCVDRLMKRLF